MKCQICHKAGHSADTCFHRYKSKDNRNKEKGNYNKRDKHDKSNKNKKKRGLTCFYCNIQGHVANECRKKKADLERQARNRNPTKSERDNTPNTSGQKRGRSWDDELDEFSGMAYDEKKGKRKTERS